MYVLYGKVQLHLPYASSLKDKRQIIQSIITRIRKRFSISMCEVDYHELRQRSDLGFAAACNTFAETDLIRDAIRDTLEQYEDRCQVMAFDHEMVNYK